MLNMLQSLGFSEKEAAIYLASLELGVASPVSTIAKKAGIHRTTTYDILEGLVQKGVIIAVKKRDTLYYEALPPQKLVAYLKEQSDRYSRLADQANSLLPELETHYRIQNRPKVYFYEGDEGLIRVYEETLTSSEEILAYASDQINQDTIPWYFPEYYARRTDRKIPIRALFPDTPKDRERHSLDDQELRMSRILPKDKFDITPEINIFDNKIMIADWKEKLGIIIESSEIATVFKQTFELAWEASEKYHNQLMNEEKGKQDEKHE